MTRAALVITLCALVAATPARADLEVRFDEGAPKDRFTVENTSGCAIGAAQITIDLSGSPFGLIFDTTGSGAGVQVFQPLELTEGAAFLRTTPQVNDGDNRVTLDLSELPPGQAVAFTIDVDDTKARREITVDDDEIVGATVRATINGTETRGTFGNTARAIVPVAQCTS